MATAVPPGQPVAPIALGDDLAATTDRLGSATVEVDGALLARLREVCAEVSIDEAERAEAGRDWWPLAMTWALAGQVGHRPAAVARPGTDAEVAAVLAVCHESGVPVTAAAGRSGVCGGSVPVHGGVLLDLCALSGIRSVDTTSMVLDVAAGTFGDRLEDTLRSEHGVTMGHWPQSIALSTVGGWLACRSAGQLSNRYGKIEDMAVGLDVALADGRIIHTGGAPRAAVGPDLNQVFIGSEGTLGVILGARVRIHALPAAEQRAAYGFDSFDAANEACRRILQRGARPAVLRVYDATEAERSYQTGERHVLLVLDEGDPALVAATMSVVADECAGAEGLDEGLVGRWMEHRNDVAALESLIAKDFVVDTMEVTGRWADLETHLPLDAGRHRRRRGHDGGQRAPVPRLHRRGLPLLHLRRAPAPDPGRQGRLLPGCVGRRHPGRPRRWRRPQPPPRRRAEPGPLHGRSARRCLRHPRRPQGRPRPEGDPQPGEAGPAQPLR